MNLTLIWKNSTCISFHMPTIGLQMINLQYELSTNWKNPSGLNFHCYHFDASNVHNTLTCELDYELKHKFLVPLILFNYEKDSVVQKVSHLNVVSKLHTRGEWNIIQNKLYTSLGEIMN
jgi:hypothetical protein